MTSCLHVGQFDGTPCGGRNCAAASCAMLIHLATGGRVRLTAAQVRALSGRSCTPMDPPDATHSRSGGLYISDVQAVAARYDVSVDYHGGTSWPADVLRRLLMDGYAAVILGDCRVAPVNPTTGVVYHSAVVHDYDVVHDTTHWHDPRLGAGVWVSVAAVEGYQLGFGGQRLAGFVRDYISLPAPAPAQPAPAPTPAPAPEPAPVILPPEPAPTTQPGPSEAPPVGGGPVVAPPPADGTPVEASPEVSDADRELLEGAGLIENGRLMTRQEVLERFSVSPPPDPETDQVS